LYRETAHIVVEGGHLVASGIVQHLLREFNRQCKI
jgi:shikimate kinase